MHRNARRPVTWLSAAALFAAVVFVAMPALDAVNPRGAYYSTDTDKLFWFVQASDTHIGALGSTDGSNLTWLVTTAKSVIAPSFIVVTGDITDSTNGNWLGLPNGPYQAEWDEYNAILSGRVTAADYYDIPGNHDAYNDRYFAYYLANSVQGRATGRTQASWVRSFPFGKYHFLGVNSAGNTGASFSFSFPYGDPAGLDSTELAFVGNQLAANADANLTLVFGHHPVTDTGASGDTWLFYGQEEFIGDLDNAASSSYGYGHTHDTSATQFTGNSYTGLMQNGGIQYLNVSAIGKDSPNQYRVFAVDCDGVSSVEASVGAWPVVLITSPVSKYVGSAANPYAYTVPNAASNTIRALVFDSAAVGDVSFRIDGDATWRPMTQVPGNTRLWSGAWDASALAAGEHAIEVRAIGSSTRSNVIKVDVTGTTPPVNRAPVAAGDAYSTNANTPLGVVAPGVLGNDSDPDGDPITASLGTSPAHGTVTLDADGSFTYTPAQDYSGPDAFTYTAGDGTATSSAATVSITVNPATQADTVEVRTASWSKKTRKLAVTAWSSAQPNAILTVEGYGVMTWNKKTRLYTYTTSVASPPSSVTVTSNLGGSGTLAVTVK